MRAIAIPKIIEERRIKTRCAECIGYSDNNIKLNFASTLKHNYIKKESVDRTYDYIIQNSGTPLSVWILFNKVFKIENFNVIKDKYKTLSTMMYWLMSMISNGLSSKPTIYYIISIMWLIVLNDYNW